MASSSITSWQIEEETIGTVRNFILGGSKIPGTGQPGGLLSMGSHRVRHDWGDLAAAKSLQMVIAAMKLKGTYLLFGRKAMTNLGSILKSRDITLQKKVQLVKAMVFPVVMCGCESWTIKKAGCWRINAFELCWRRLLRVLWTARRSNLSILKETSPEYSLEGLILKLKLQSFGHMLQRIGTLEESLMLGKIEGRRKRGRQRKRWLYGIINWMDMSLSKLWELVMDREACHDVFHGVTKSWTQLNNWSDWND